LTQTPSKKNPNFDVQESLLNFDSLANMPNAFVGRTAKTDRGVLLALIYWAQQIGAYTIHPGVRKIAEISAVDKRTVISSLKRLEEKGWITCSYRAHPMSGKASIWNLNLREFEGAEVSEAVSYGVLSDAIENLSIWTNQGLGQNCRTIYKLLAYPGKPLVLRVSKIQQITGLGRNAIDKCISELIRARLVHKHGFWLMVIRHPADQLEWVIEEIYKDWNLSVKARGQIELHKIERMVFRRKLRYLRDEENHHWELRKHESKQLSSSEKRRERELT
jgi:hypothetical protein